MSGQIIGYVHVSSTEQNLARQVAALGTVDEMFTDRISGLSRSDRPALAAMLRHAQRGYRAGRVDGSTSPVGGRSRAAGAEGDR